MTQIKRGVLLAGLLVMLIGIVFHRSAAINPGQSDDQALESCSIEDLECAVPDRPQPVPARLPDTGPIPTLAPPKPALAGPSANSCQQGHVVYVTVEAEAPSVRN